MTGVTVRAIWIREIVRGTSGKADQNGKAVTVSVDFQGNVVAR